MTRSQHLQDEISACELAMQLTAQMWNGITPSACLIERLNRLRMMALADRYGSAEYVARDGVTYAVPAGCPEKEMA